MTRCSATRANGEQCRAQALPEQALCWAHSPEMRDRAAAARKAGGENSSNAARASKRIPKDLHDVRDRLLGAIAKVEDGKLTPRQGQAMATLAAALVKVHEAGEVNERLAELERRLEAKDGWQRRQG